MHREPGHATRLIAPTTPPSAFVARRKALHERFAGAALLPAGEPPSRNYRANVYRFRASSHFLYFVGRAIPGAALLLHEGKSVLYTAPPDPEDALWHGPRPELGELGDELQLDAVRPLSALGGDVAGLGHVATLPPQDAPTARWLSEVLSRPVTENAGDRLDGADAALADAVIGLRLVHDEAAQAQLRFAATVSVKAHVAGMQATHSGGSERDALAAMTGVLRMHGCDDAYGPIVTTCGEVLHSSDSSRATWAGDLLLVDMGGESPEGWASDITRTWPVSGRFSATQRSIYQLVLGAQRAAIAAAQPGARYREVHETAKRSIVAGLCELGIFRGEVDGLLERGAAALFFPHGIGHLLGLDVHDMEDLGDRAGYAAGRTRSERFGDAYLRLDRDLAPGMAVTIEPGFYQVPGILGDERLTSPLGSDFNRDELKHFSDVRGIRIEDDVLITESGNQVLTSGLPKEPREIEALVSGERLPPRPGPSS
jgi:Xaa-Pro aminopeptidase